MAEGDYLSEVMNNILDSLGLDEENRQRRMRVQRVTQMLDKWLWKFVKNESVSPLWAGSTYETTTIAGLSSDIDYIVIWNSCRAIHNIEQWIPDDKRITYMIDEEDCYPSYVKLYRVAPHYPGPLYQDMIHNILVHPEDIVDRDGKFYRSSLLTINSCIEQTQSRTESTETHGPAVNFVANMDTVIAFPCEFFPRSALKWKERQTTETLSRVGESIINEANHCHVVPVGNKSSPNVHLEWRYSFTHIERQLVHAWNNVQYKLYVMMKFILKDLIEPFVPDVISSYHIKTILFWMNEEYKREFFELSNFNQCLLTYLKNLLDTVKRQSLPHYFIEECNLYYNKIDQGTARQLTNIIQDIIDTWPRRLCDIKRRHLGSNLYYVMSAEMPLQTICDINNRKRRYMENCGMPRELRCLFLAIHITKEEMWHHKMAISELESALDIIKKLSDSTSDMEVKNFLEFFTGNCLCDAAIHFLITNSVTQNKTETSNTIKAVTYIQRYVNDCCIDTRLKVAAFLVFTGDFQGGTVLLDRIACQMKQYIKQLCSHRLCETYVDMPHIATILDNKPTLSEYIKHYTAHTVEYTSDMIGHLPKALVYEMFRSTSVSPSPAAASFIYEDFTWHQQAIIHSPVFMYFLRYVIAKSKRQYTETKAAIDNMKRASKQIAGSPHCETNHNIIGHCLMERCNPQSAFREYKRSMNAKKHHNAAIWQIAVLLRRNIRGDQ